MTDTQISEISSSVRPRTGERNGLRLLVLAGILWGTGGLTGSLLARSTGLTSAAVAACRLGVGGLLLVLFVLVSGRAMPKGRAAWTRIVTLGLLAAEFQASYFAAVERVSVSLATLLTIGASPVLVLIAEGVLGRRRTGPRALATVLLAITGLTLLIGVPNGERDLTTLLSGAGFALLAAGGFATMTLVGSRPVKDLDDLAGTGLAFTLGAVVLAPLAIAGGGQSITATWSGLGLLVLLGVGPTAIAYAAYFRGLRTSAAGTAALMALLEPLVGTALSVLILGDRLGMAGTAGAALLVLALVVEAKRA
ncbi:DMT family transporter [Actinoplanes sp. NPDC051513]|uniref:DMT family transporter n=1 Tax=Actinoplanes sp. NPDC051513 TaxID=3363908 RepID=UPI0037ACCF7B